MKKPILSLIISLATLLLLSACSKVKDPEFRRLEHFGVKNVDLQQATVGFDVTYFNPNNFGVTVKEAVLDLYIDSFYLGKFSQPMPIAVNSTAEFSIPLEGTISWREAANKKMQRLAGTEVLVRATGGAKIGKGGVFISKDIRYEGRHTLDLGLLKNPAGAGFGF